MWNRARAMREIPRGGAARAPRRAARRDHQAADRLHRGPPAGRERATPAAGATAEGSRREDVMRIRDVMSEGVRTVAPTSTVEKAFEQMRIEGIRHLVVTDGGRLVGLLSERDAGGRRGAAVRQHRTVAELMTPQVVTVRPDATIRQTANLMRGRSIGSVVVVDGRRIAGIVTVSDLLALIGRGVERPVAATTRWTLKHRTPHRKRASAAGVW
jgi:CBS domain-containing protein